MKQLGLADARLVKRSKKTRKEAFLAEMNTIIPWQRLLATIAPHYPEAARGRRRVPLETLLRIHLLQHFFNYSDPAMEEALYEVPLYCRFVGIDLAVDTVPDETTICKFRHLLERHRLADAFLAEINAELSARGLLLKKGTVVDATLIAAPPSTKNKERKRDPEMSSTKKGNQWYFGMKAHIGADADSGLVHSLIFTKAKVPDNKVLDDLLHGEEEAAHGDKAYTDNEHNLLASDPEKGPIWCMPFKKPSGGELPEWKRDINRRLASLRAIVEFPFRVVKRQFRFTKVRYRGLFKNGQALTTKFALANLYTVRRTLLSSTG
jgi:IS5 family transposase